MLSLQNLKLQNISVTEYSTPGSSKWLLQFVNSGNIYYNITNIAVAQSGNIYAVGQWVDITSGTYVENLIVKIDSEGNIIWAVSSSSTNAGIFGSYYDVYVDSSENIYVLGFRAEGDQPRHCIQKFNSSGAILLQVRSDYNVYGTPFFFSFSNTHLYFTGGATFIMKASLSNITGSTSTVNLNINGYYSGAITGICYNSTNNTVHCTADNNILTLDSDLNAVTAASFTYSGGIKFMTCAMDNLGNLYAIGFPVTNNNVVILKLNSSTLSVIWSLEISSPVGNNINYSGWELSISDGFIYATCNSTNRSKLLIYKISLAGSLIWSRVISGSNSADTVYFSGVTSNSTRFYYGGNVEYGLITSMDVDGSGTGVYVVGQLEYQSFVPTVSTPSLSSTTPTFSTGVTGINLIGESLTYTSRTITPNRYLIT